jgi:hypothetical protein
LEEKIREERKEQKIMTSAKRDTTVVLVHAAWADGSSWNKEFLNSAPMTARRSSVLYQGSGLEGVSPRNPEVI